MIEQSIMNYLLGIPEINTMLSGKLFYRRAPQKATMPWAIISTPGGMRNRLTQGGQTSPGLTAPYNTISLYVESLEQFRGREIANRIQRALENFRGNLGTERDVRIRCQEIRDLDGWQGSFRYLLSIHVGYMIDTNVAG